MSEASSKKRILVSICVVTYNHAKYIAKCLDSLLMQEGDFDMEILLHDDASTDGAQEIIKQYQMKYPDILKPILRVENQYSKGITNISGAFNFPRASGQYIALIDGDDYWCDKRKLSKQVEYMEAHPDCVFTFHSAKVVNEDGSMSDASLMRPYRKSQVLDSRQLVDKASGAPFGSFLLKREVVETLPDYYVECPVGDRPLELMAASAGTAYYFDEAMSVYRFGIGSSWTGNQMSGDVKKKQEIYAQRMEKMYADFDRETDGRFHQEAERAAKRVRFLTEVNTRDFNKIYSKDNAEFLKELSFRDRFFIKFEYRLPKLYKWLQEKHHQK